VPNPELPTLDGGKAPLVGTARANVFVFFRPGQEHSLHTLEQLAALVEELRGKPVRFVAVTSDGYDREAVRATLAEAKLAVPVLLDVGDALYGALGVRLHPVVGIADARGRLAAYQHFLKVNQQDVLRGRIRLLLGEIGDAEMQAIVAPPPATDGGPRVAAQRRVNLGRQLLAHGRPEPALDNARRALELAPGLPAAHALAAEALAATGKCAEARAEAKAAAGEKVQLGGCAGR
jgi:hypothetical protein